MDTIFRVWSDSFEDGKPIPEGFAFAKPDPMGKEHTLPAGNRNPQIAWSNPPLGTKSLIVICEDNDVPADFSKANVEGETIPADAPRTSFIHWVLVDIVPEEPCIDAASLSKGISPRGKKGPACANGMRQGLNDYTDAFKGDPNNEGHYYGYDGPCPPWNDERVHRYVLRSRLSAAAPQGELQRQRCHRSHERPHPRVGLHRRDLHSEPEAAEKFLIAFSTKGRFSRPFGFYWSLSHGTKAICSRPSVSGRPMTRFMACTACPAEPLTKLSSTTKITKRSGSLR